MLLSGLRTHHFTRYLTVQFGWYLQQRLAGLGCRSRDPYSERAKPSSARGWTHFLAFGLAPSLFSTELIIHILVAIPEPRALAYHYRELTDPPFIVHSRSKLKKDSDWSFKVDLSCTLNVMLVQMDGGRPSVCTGAHLGIPTLSLYLLLVKQKKQPGGDSTTCTTCLSPEPDEEDSTHNKKVSVEDTDSQGLPSPGGVERSSGYPDFSHLVGLAGRPAADIVNGPGIDGRLLPFGDKSWPRDD
ncbi:hypothetical protein BDN72DRAFT_964500 [Pluteus cervinus]|uniref:Uncharacterized protein n=1 Tax=Pluteus cervinus TaxID=181527 RepID=A0ACD3ACF6_9AGAR|nr:hypothetical protein BDN72DRAFT_964500 [Pluteus cervinus]